MKRLCKPRFLIGMAVVFFGPLATRAAEHMVFAMPDFTFQPSELTIVEGDTVTWTNNGGFHNVRADDDSFRCADGCDDAGGNGNPSTANWSFSLVFTDPEIIAYYCEIHGGPGGFGMSGTVEVISAPSALFCFSFDNLCDGIQISTVLPDRTVVATWRNWDCAGATAPVLGGYSGNTVSPRGAWLAADPGGTLSTWSFNLNVDARTFDLWVHDTAFNLIQTQDDQPYSVTPGACTLGPEKRGRPASTGVGE